MTILYISYDGMLEPLGRSQVLAYLKKLALNHKICLISYEKPHDWKDIEQRNELYSEITTAGIIWYPLIYHKRLSVVSTSFDLLKGIILSSWIIVRHNIRIIHARSYVPSVIALFFKKLLSIKFIFDMRGFWADEKIDSGSWSRNSYIYQTAKWFERHFLLSADKVISLTQSALNEIQTFDYLQNHAINSSVITTCANLDIFKIIHNNNNVETLKRPFTVGYVGSVTAWYMFDETLKCFMLLRELIPDAQLYILNKGDHDYIKTALARNSIPETVVRLEMASNHLEVAKAINSMDVGIFFIKPFYSKIASAPTKLAEFLGCGVPCLSNTGIGDMGAIIEDTQVGVAIDNFKESTIKNAIIRLVKLTQKPNIKQHCRNIALEHFSLEIGSTKYNDIYNELLAGNNQ